MDNPVQNTENSSESQDNEVSKILLIVKFLSAQNTSVKL